MKPLQQLRQFDRGKLLAVLPNLLPNQEHGHDGEKQDK